MKEFVKAQHKATNYEKAAVYGVVLGYMVSMLYLMLQATAALTAQQTRWIEGMLSSPQSI